VALRRGVPVPALLQSDVRIPLEFRRVQAANLSQWSPGRASPEFDQLFVAVHATDTGNGRVVSEGSYNVLLLRDAPGRVVLSTQVSVPNGDSGSQRRLAHPGGAHARGEPGLRATARRRQAVQAQLHGRGAA